MRSLIDFSSWHALLTTVIGLLLASLLMVGIRLLVMQTIQRRRERENRQINERLKTLIAAYKTLGGSFTGQLQVSPVHLRDVHLRTVQAQDPAPTEDGEAGEAVAPPTSSERQRRMRDAVEAALSDVILLGTQEQVELAARAAQDMVAGRSIATAQLVVSLRDFIRTALDLDPLPASLAIPHQGPLRPAGGAGGGARGGAAGAGAAGGRGGGAGGGAGAGGGGGMGMVALGAGAGAGSSSAAAAVEPAGDDTAGGGAR